MALSIALIVLVSDFGMIRLTLYLGLPPERDGFGVNALRYENLVCGPVTTFVLLIVVSSIIIIEITNGRIEFRSFICYRD